MPRLWVVLVVEAVEARLLPQARQAHPLAMEAPPLATPVEYVHIQVGRVAQAEVVLVEPVTMERETVVIKREHRRKAALAYIVT